MSTQQASVRYEEAQVYLHKAASNAAFRVMWGASGSTASELHGLGLGLGIQGLRFPHSSQLPQRSISCPDTTGLMLQTLNSSKTPQAHAPSQRFRAASPLRRPLLATSAL